MASRKNYDSRPYRAPPLTARPHRVVKVDDIRVRVPEGSVLVWMAMRLLSLPALVRVLMMLVVEVQVLVFERVVHVFRLAGVVSRPQSQRREGRSQRHKPKHRQSNRQLERGSDPASEGVSEQPACVR